MVTSLFKHEQLETTDARAKELRQVAEKMITLAKRGDLHARRQALATIREKAVVHKLFDELKDRFRNVNDDYKDPMGGMFASIVKGTANIGLDIATRVANDPAIQQGVDAAVQGAIGMAKQNRRETDALAERTLQQAQGMINQMIQLMGMARSR